MQRSRTKIDPKKTGAKIEKHRKFENQSRNFFPFPFHSDYSIPSSGGYESNKGHSLGVQPGIRDASNAWGGPGNQIGRRGIERRYFAVKGKLDT